MRPQWMSNVDCECPKRGQKYLRISVCLFWFVFVVVFFYLHCGMRFFYFLAKTGILPAFCERRKLRSLPVGEGWKLRFIWNACSSFHFLSLYFIDTCPTKQSICTKTHRWHFLCFLQVVVVKLAGSQHLRLKCLNLNINVTCCVAIKRSRI